jgi:hypothetical protein
MSIANVNADCLPCPCCGAKAKPRSNMDYKREIICSNAKCGMRTPFMLDETWERLKAIWNRRPVESFVEPEGASGT